MSETIIKVSVKDQELSLITRPVVSSGGVNENAVQFYTDESWIGYTKEAFFYKEGVDPVRVIVIEGEAAVPAEMTAEDGQFSFGLVGYGDNVKTTELIAFDVVNGAISASEEELIPTPEIYAQIVNLAANANKTVEEIKAEIDRGVVPAFRDLNTGGAVRAWSGTMAEYVAVKDSLPDGVIAIIDDLQAEYLVQKTDAVVHYSGGSAEAVFRVTSPDVPVNIEEKGLYASKKFNITFPEYVTAEPYSCSVVIEKTGDDSVFAFLAVSGSWSATKTQNLKIYSSTKIETVSVTFEVRARFKWSEG